MCISVCRIRATGSEGNSGILKWEVCNILVQYCIVVRSMFNIVMDQTLSSSLSQVRFYEGVVELSLTAAEKKDPQGLGLHFYKNGEPDEDIVGLQAFQERQVFRIYGQFYSRHFTHKNFSADLGGMIDKPSRIKSRVRTHFSQCMFLR